MSFFRGRFQAARDISQRYPISQFWDSSEPRLIVCEVKRIPGTQAIKGNVMQEVAYSLHYFSHFYFFKSSYTSGI